MLIKAEHNSRRYPDIHMELLRKPAQMKNWPGLSLAIVVGVVKLLESFLLLDVTDANLDFFLHFSSSFLSKGALLLGASHHAVD